MDRKTARRILVTILILLAASLVFHRFLAAQAGPGDRPGKIEVDGRSRSYFVHVPPRYDGKIPMPLVFVLHGATQSAISAEHMSGMSTKADKENFLAVYPTGTSRYGHFPTWNAGNCCGYAQTNHVDDVAFLRALIGKLERDYRVDSRRIYFTGISNGAMMSFRAACELSDLVAAVAPVEGAQNITCKPSSPVSVIVFHGTADRLVPIEGGSTPFQLGSRRSDTPAADTVAFWVKEDACSPTPTHRQAKDLDIDSYSGCKEGTGVAFYVIEGGHHMWPGLRISRNDVPATDIMWEFFVQHPKADP